MAYSASSDIGSWRVEIPASAGFAFTPRVAAVYNARARKPRPPMFRMVTKLLIIALARIWAVHFGRVEECNTLGVGLTNDPDGIVDRGGRAVVCSQVHAPKSEFRYFQHSKFSRPHAFSYELITVFGLVGCKATINFECRTYNEARSRTAQPQDCSSNLFGATQATDGLIAHDLFHGIWCFLRQRLQTSASRRHRGRLRLTPMPKGAYSIATLFVSPMTPNFVA